MKPDVKCGPCLLEWVYGRTLSQKKNEKLISKVKTSKSKRERAFCPAAMGNVVPKGMPSGAFTFPELMDMAERKGPVGKFVIKVDN